MFIESTFISTQDESQGAKAMYDIDSQSSTSSDFNPDSFTKSWLLQVLLYYI